MPPILPKGRPHPQCTAELPLFLALDDRTVRRGDETIHFAYWEAQLDRETVIGVTIVTRRDGRPERRYGRHWPRDRWAMPVKQNFEAKFLADPWIPERGLYRERFRLVDEEAP